MTRPCNWTFETKVIIVCDSFFRKPIPIVIVFQCYNQPLKKPVGVVTRNFSFLRFSSYDSEFCPGWSHTVYGGRDRYLVLWISVSV